MLKHGLSYTPEYKTWKAMRNRCYNSRSESYHHYGGRGIVMGKTWRNDFAQFYKDMGPRPSPKHSIDRFPDNNGNYEPGNCRWATVTEQGRNRRTNRLLTVNEVTLTVTEWAERNGIKWVTIFARLRRGFTPEEAVAPVSHRRRGPQHYRWNPTRH